MADPFSGATIAGDVTPDVTGRDLGATGQRWDVFAQSIDVSGTATIPTLVITSNLTTTAPVNSSSTNGSIFQSSSTSSAALSASATALTGTTYGVQGNVNSASGYGVAGFAPNAGHALAAFGAGGVERFYVTGGGAITGTSISVNSAQVNPSGLTIGSGTPITAQSGTGGTVAMTVGAVLSSPSVSDAGFTAGFSLGLANLTLANGANNNITLASNPIQRIIGPTGAFSVSGLAGGTDGRIIHLFNTTSFAMTITNNATSTATNRILTLTGADIVLRAGTSCASLFYSSTDGRWIVMSTN